MDVLEYRVGDVFTDGIKEWSIVKKNKDAGTITWTYVEDSSQEHEIDIERTRHWGIYIKIGGIITKDQGYTEGYKLGYTGLRWL